VQSLAVELDALLRVRVGWQGRLLELFFIGGFVGFVGFVGSGLIFIRLGVRLGHCGDGGGQYETQGSEGERGAPASFSEVEKAHLDTIHGGSREPYRML
jgi:hypothetical protein